MISSKENVLLTNKHVFVCTATRDTVGIDRQYLLPDLEFIKKNFCGLVITELDELKTHKFG